MASSSADDFAITESDAGSFVFACFFFFIVTNMFAGADKVDIACEQQTGFSEADGVFEVWQFFYIVVILGALEQFVATSTRPDFGLPNVLFGCAWIALSFWTFFISQKDNVSLMFATLASVAVATLAMAATTSANLFKGKLDALFQRPVTAIAFSSFAGWSFIVAVINILMLVNADYDKRDNCEETLSMAPLALTIAFVALGYYFCDPVIIGPILWALTNLPPTILRSICITIGAVGIVVAVYRMANKQPK